MVYIIDFEITTKDLEMRKLLFIEEMKNAFYQQFMFHLESTDEEMLKNLDDWDESKCIHHALKVPKSDEDYNFIADEIRNKTREHMMLIILDQKNHICGYEVIQVGDVYSISDYLNNMLKTLYKYDKNKFILMHNHPYEVQVVFSDGDDLNVVKINKLCEILELEMVDFVAVTSFDNVRKEV